MDRKTIFTTAPPDYDYGSTEVLDPEIGEVKGHGLADGTVRLVNANHNQRERYRSGGFLVSEAKPTRLMKEA